MGKKKSVSGKTHTKAQMDNYANQKNPNNKCYKAIHKHKSKTCTDVYTEVDPFSLGWCED